MAQTTAMNDVSARKVTTERALPAAEWSERSSAGHQRNGSEKTATSEGCSDIALPVIAELLLLPVAEDHRVRDAEQQQASGNPEGRTADAKLT